MFFFIDPRPGPAEEEENEGATTTTTTAYLGFALSRRGIGGRDCGAYLSIYSILPIPGFAKREVRLKDRRQTDWQSDQWNRATEPQPHPQQQQRQLMVRSAFYVFNYLIKTRRWDNRKQQFYISFWFFGSRALVTATACSSSYHLRIWRDTPAVTLHVHATSLRTRQPRCGVQVCWWWWSNASLLQEKWRMSGFE